MLTIEQIANGINIRSKKYRIGKLQEIRKKIKKLNRLPCKEIFGNKTINDRYAYHTGGRTELQYNIGKIDTDYRHGVAFSLQKDQTLQNPADLYPNIERFNEYISKSSEKYSDMMLWIWDENDVRHDYKAGQIISDFVHPGVFIFFGKLQKENSFSYDEILKDFDRLLPLYEYVEGETKKPKSSFISEEQFKKEAEIRERQAAELSDKELIDKIKSAPQKVGSRDVIKEVISTQYYRDQNVAEYSRRRAKGLCQLCGNDAPFKSIKGNPYLEIHHIEWLSKDGKDTIDNTCALCPNCHRKMHNLNLKKDKTHLLEQASIRLGACFSHR